MIKQRIANDFIRMLAENDTAGLRAWYIVTTGNTTVTDNELTQKAAQYIQDMR